MEQLLAGLNLMAIGMSVVFLFLGLLVLVVTLMARLAPTGSAGESADGSVPEAHLAAISAAIHDYRNRTRNTRP